MNKNFREIEDLFSGYFSGELSEDERKLVDQWRNESSENDKIFKVASSAWGSLLILNEMEQYNSFGALKDVSSRLPKSRTLKWVRYFQRIAAVIVIPLMIYAAYTEINNRILDEKLLKVTLWQSVTTKDGIVSRFTLPDSTKVWLNSGSVLQFPYSFSKEKREVRLNGEAYFEVTRNEKLPFVIKANKLEVIVLGTILNVINNNGRTSEVVLVSGKVSLVVNNGTESKNYGTLYSGQRAVFNNETENIQIDRVEADTYTLWREGGITIRKEQISH